MAGSLSRCLINLNFGLLSRTVVNRHVAVDHIRTLFSQESLGLIAFNSTRDHYMKQFLNLEDSFRTKMNRYVTDDSSSMIFTEDLKVMVHLVEKTPEDIELLVKMLKKFNNQSSDMRFGTYTFGPIVMRAFHRLNDWETALKLFNDPEFDMFFSQLSSYQVLLDLLYCNEQYAKMRTLYDKIQLKFTDGKAHPRNALILVSAACYKENTPESLQYALDLWKELCRRGYPTIRRVIINFSALATKQKQHHAALEILTVANKPGHIAIRCLKIIVYSELDRFENIIPFFRQSLELDSASSYRKETYFKDAIDRVEAAIERNNLPDDAEIVKLLNLIKSADMVQDETLERYMESEVHVVSQLHRRDNNNYQTHSSHYDLSGPKSLRRPGLRDIM